MPRLKYTVGRDGFRLFGKWYQPGDDFFPEMVPINQRKLRELIDEGYLIRADQPAAAKDGSASVSPQPGTGSAPQASAVVTPLGGGGWYKVTWPNGASAKVRGKAKAEDLAIKLAPKVTENEKAAEAAE